MFWFFFFLFQAPAGKFVKVVKKNEIKTAEYLIQFAIWLSFPAADGAVRYKHSLLEWQTLFKQRLRIRFWGILLGKEWEKMELCLSCNLVLRAFHLKLIVNTNSSINGFKSLI